jgi:hypothetical protein
MHGVSPAHIHEFPRTDRQLAKILLLEQGVLDVRVVNCVIIQNERAENNRISNLKTAPAVSVITVRNLI